ncbi:MAG: homocysteine methyltransferase [Ruminococcaceae bacterium]|nr:homocysteine methyltransferase [Oscillospiraceae bacterium]
MFNLKEILAKGPLFLDGGMGTILQSMGLTDAERPEDWNITYPERITKVHKDYIDAGSRILLANTFGANTRHYNLENGDLEKIVDAAIANARNAAGQREDIYVALDIGPSGKMLAPYGDLDFEDAVTLFAETVKLGVKAGADLIVIETMNDCYETKAAVLAAKENSNLPIFVTNAYGADGLLMTGASAEVMCAMLEGLGVDAIGLNCSMGPREMLPVIKRFFDCASIPIIVKPNAGMPYIENGKTCYDVSPSEFAEWMEQAYACGGMIFGGCCGTTPAYITALTNRLAGKKPHSITEKENCVISSGFKTVRFGEKPILIGERINPTGKKAFKQALREGDLSYILGEGIRQLDFGAEVLDVNVGLPEIDEGEWMLRSITGLQSVVDVPLQIDTSDASVLEKALRRYNGKALINSVNGSEESMESVLPLVKKYGGVVVVLTLDEKGIPQTAKERLAIAERVACRAEQYGISRKDLIVDTLTMTVSSDTSAPGVTLDALRLCKEAGLHTSLGVSNISFGLPQRDNINAVFFTMALQMGLDAAIMNPYSVSMMNAYYSYLVLSGKDLMCADYIKFASTLSQGTQMAMQTPINQSDSHKENEKSALQQAIIKGLSEDAYRYALMCMQEKSPLSIVEEEIVPALDSVGKGYEAKTVFLPQLLMSADAAKKAFSAIKSQMGSDSKTVEKYTIVVATVKGDIHDIGKNIVVCLLENYGYRVVDLGHDASPQTVLDAAKKENARLVGLSALMTTTVPAMKETVDLLRRELPQIKIMVGGAVLTDEYAKAMKADHYGPDAMSAVRFAETLL